MGVATVTLRVWDWYGGWGGGAEDSSREKSWRRKETICWFSRRPGSSWSAPRSAAEAAEEEGEEESRPRGPRRATEEEEEAEEGGPSGFRGARRRRE